MGFPFQGLRRKALKPIADFLEFLLLDDGVLVETDSVVFVPKGGRDADVRIR